MQHGQQAPAADLLATTWANKIPVKLVLDPNNISSPTAVHPLYVSQHTRAWRGGQGWAAAPPEALPSCVAFQQQRWCRPTLCPP